MTLILTINADYNYQLPELPQSLVTLTLTFDDDYDRPLSLILPESLEHLSIEYPRNYLEIELPELPHTLTHLTLGVDHNFNGTFDYLPQGLLYFALIGYHGEPLVNLPNTLQTLNIYAHYDKTLDMLPDSIEFLDIKYYREKINKLPQNLKQIRINKGYKYKDDLLLLLLLKPDVVIKKVG